MKHWDPHERCPYFEGVHSRHEWMADGQWFYCPGDGMWKVVRARLAEVVYGRERERW